MGVNIPGWSPDLERSFKEILFRFLEEVHSTKAALYLQAGDGSYVLMTQYGFGRRDALASEHHQGAPLVIKAREIRSKPEAFNDIDRLPDIAGYLEGAGNARLLLVPLYTDSGLIGFIDARDKGRKRQFSARDVDRAGIIGDAVLSLIRRAGLYSDEEETEVGPVDPTEPRLRTVAPAAIDVKDARGVLDSPGLNGILETLGDVILLPGIYGIVLSVAGGKSATSVVYATEALQQFDKDALLRHQGEALFAEGIGPVESDNWRVGVRRVPVGLPPEPHTVIATEVLLHESDWGLVASVLAASGCPSVMSGMERMRRRAQLESRLARMRFSRRVMARRLLVPGEHDYAELASHSEAVSRLTWQIGSELGWDQERLETGAIAGLLHDVGMRELDYDRLYRHRSPGSEERREYQRHVEIGEKLLADLGLPEVTRAVRHHHERWDGEGYPDRLHGEAIPELARVIHVAEVYDVLTSPQSYRERVSMGRAMEILQAGSGRQFGPGLVDVLAKVVQ